MPLTSNHSYSQMLNACSFLTGLEVEGEVLIYVPSRILDQFQTSKKVLIDFQWVSSCLCLGLASHPLSQNIYWVATRQIPIQPVPTLSILANQRSNLNQKKRRSHHLPGYSTNHPHIIQNMTPKVNERHSAAPWLKRWIGNRVRLEEEEEEGNTCCQAHCLAAVLPHLN